jgi:hypothetical protein
MNWVAESKGHGSRPWQMEGSWWTLYTSVEIRLSEVKCWHKNVLSFDISKSEDQTITT